MDRFLSVGRGSPSNPPADRLTLLRRVHLDLTGLAPTPAEQDAFLADTAPDAYEKVVDRLLADEQHAVRYARHWLDVLRYADADERTSLRPVRAGPTHRTPLHRAHPDVGHRPPLPPRAAPRRWVRPGIPGARRRCRPAGAGHERGGHRLQRVPGHDGRLRQVSRPCLRSRVAGRLLLDEGALRPAGPAQGDAGFGRGPHGRGQGTGRTRTPARPARSRTRRPAGALSAQAPRRPHRHAPARDPDRHPQARARAQRRGAEDRRRLLPHPADRWRQGRRGAHRRPPQEGPRSRASDRRTHQRIQAHERPRHPRVP
ncbi:MAG: DUF1549 domain-containing protein, partial [Actinobacteria bacterium]|nr:DUF1549 domain-containing protein [Actinomycetota bacterium]